MTPDDVYVPVRGDQVEVTIRGTVSHFGGSNRVLVITDEQGKKRFFHFAPFALYRDPGITVTKIPDPMKAVS